jgi:hypothetical protein
LAFFLFNEINTENFHKNSERVIERFIRLDDSDIIASAKEWTTHNDKVLSLLAQNLINRNLPKVKIIDQLVDPGKLDQISENICVRYDLTREDSLYFIFIGEISNNAFSSSEGMVQILMNNGETKDISEVSDILNVPYLQKSEKKYFICFPKDCGV